MLRAAFARHTALPQQDREVIEEGGSAKKILTKKAMQEWQERSRDRLLLHDETGEISDEVAQIIIDFCSRRKRVSANSSAEGRVSLVLFPVASVCI
jgi:hypothetical protein